MNPIIERIIKKAKSDKEVLAIFLFGSAARGESFRESDIDICLIMNNKSEHTPEGLFQKRLDYLQNFNLDIQIFQELPIYIKMRIIREGKLLFCREEDDLYELVFKTIQEFCDFEYFYKNYLEEVERAG